MAVWNSEIARVDKDRHNVADFLALAHDAVARNAEHAGIILVPSSFRGDEFQAIADAVHVAVSQHPKGLAGLVIYLRQSP